MPTVQDMSERAGVLHLRCEETGEVYVLVPTRFSTGSLGWSLASGSSRSMLLPCGSDKVKASLTGINIVCTGTRPSGAKSEVVE